MRPTLFSFLLALIPAAGCNSSGNTAQPAIGDGLPADCSPLRTPGACMMPWPNAIYLQQNASTPTGYRLALDPATLPVIGGNPNKTMDVTRWNMADGFSPNGPMLYYFAEHIDPASLVP